MLRAVRRRAAAGGGHGGGEERERSVPVQPTAVPCGGLCGPVSEPGGRVLVGQRGRAARALRVPSPACIRDRVPDSRGGAQRTGGRVPNRERPGHRGASVRKSKPTVLHVAGPVSAPRARAILRGAVRRAPAPGLLPLLRLLQQALRGLRGPRRRLRARQPAAAARQVPAPRLRRRGPIPRLGCPPVAGRCAQNRRAVRRPQGRGSGPPALQASGAGTAVQPRRPAERGARGRGECGVRGARGKRSEHCAARGFAPIVILVLPAFMNRPHSAGHALRQGPPRAPPAQFSASYACTPTYAIYKPQPACGKAAMLGKQVFGAAAAEQLAKDFALLPTNVTASKIDPVRREYALPSSRIASARPRRASDACADTRPCSAHALLTARGRFRMPRELWGHLVGPAPSFLTELDWQ